MSDLIHLDREKRLVDWLASGGLRPTRQRLALAALLVGDGEDRHVTAEGLYAAAAGTAEKVSLATVYNTLRAFCDAGLMNEVVVDGSRSYFDTRLDDHPHFYWEDSGRLTDAPANQLRIAELPAAPEGATITRVDVVIRLRKA
ncbi:iron response transcriptional regulator IrrA [Tabrizicola sp.]|uniref:iron response transcriptional regulator IrrA n=1 Tax=Tabrizicola sp. TaxID=2005166 RepID=UPI003D2D450F